MKSKAIYLAAYFILVNSADAVLDGAASSHFSFFSFPSAFCLQLFYEFFGVVRALLPLPWLLLVVRLHVARMEADGRGSVTVYIT